MKSIPTRLLYSIFLSVTIPLLLHRFFPSMTATSTPSKRAPVWFIAHGGPPTLFDTDHKAYQHWLKVIQDIKQASLRGIVFVSAHWQAEREDFLQSTAKRESLSVLINTNASNPLIYDFYGFPSHYYQTKFRSRNPEELHEAVAEHLRKRGYNIQETDRGIDHGVWVPLRASGEEFDVPLVQVSLPISTNDVEDTAAALRLGRALGGLRDQGYAVIGGGQPVHNLRDFGLSMRGRMPSGQGYGTAFPSALTEALSRPGTGKVDSSSGDPAKWNEAKALLWRPDFRNAHPTSEHLLPVFVALGASDESEVGVEEFRLDEGPLAWTMYRFG
jgi:4,5-DOPA dioxygenase extradiol